MKTPADCNSLSEVRHELDHIDEQMVALLGLRADYVKAAARFKTSESAVAAPERLAAMIEVRRTWAAEQGLDPDFIEKFYRDLVAYFVARELDHWRNTQVPALEGTSPDV